MSATGFSCRGWIDHWAKTLSEEYRRLGLISIGIESRPVRCAPCPGQVNSVKHREEGSCTRRIALEDVRPVRELEREMHLNEKGHLLGRYRSLECGTDVLGMASLLEVD